MTIEDDILRELTPDAAERRTTAEARTSLEGAATKALQAMGIDGTAQVQGSIAKDTWIAGDADMDCFLVMPLDTPENALEGIVTKVADVVLEDAQKKYAQHPYLIGRRDGFQVDLVPAYRIESPDQRLSAVDRTPLHTEWVMKHLDDDAKDQVRLTKQWCKGVGVYGAETRIGGFSGYLIEVLIDHLGGFGAFLGWAAGGCAPRRIVTDADDVQDDVSPLVVVDPVDPTRNCAAAVTDNVLETTQEAANAYRDRPDRRFFFPAPPLGEADDDLHRHQTDAGETWMGIVLRPHTDRLDLVFPQFQRAVRVATEALERAGFTPRRTRVDILDEGRSVGLQWVLDDAPLPATRTHQGPPTRHEQNASRFRDKWNGHPDAEGGVVVGDDGRLAVTVRITARTPEAWLQEHLGDALPGKHVQKALQRDPRVISDPAQAPEGWKPMVADHVLDRRPWQRP